MARQVVGIDPNDERLAAACRQCPPLLRARVAFVQARAEVLPFPNGLFDGTILGWSL